MEDNQIVEREKLIAYIKNYIQKKNELPPTTLEFYRYGQSSCNQDNRKVIHKGRIQ